ECVWRMAAQRVMIDRGHAGGGKAEQEAVDGDLVTYPARLRRPVVAIIAAIAAAAKILELQGGVDRPGERTGAQESLRLLPDAAPEARRGDDQRRHGQSEHGAEGPGYDRMRH